MKCRDCQNWTGKGQPSDDDHGYRCTALSMAGDANTYDALLGIELNHTPTAIYTKGEFGCTLFTKRVITQGERLAEFKPCEDCASNIHPDSPQHLTRGGSLCDACKHNSLAVAYWRERAEVGR